MSKVWYPDCEDDNHRRPSTLFAFRMNREKLIKSDEIRV